MHYPHCALSGWIQGDEMTGCMGEASDPQRILNCELLAIAIECHEAQSRTTIIPLWAVVMHTYEVFIIIVATKCPQPIDDNQP